MKESQLKIIYRKKILPESKNPYQFGCKRDYSHSFTAYNPLCGDKYELFIDISDGEVKNCAFDGMGCALSRASTSLLLRNLPGMKVSDALEFLSAFLSKETTWDNELSILSEIKNSGGRIDCINLSWEAIQKELLKE